MRPRRLALGCALVLAGCSGLAPLPPTAVPDLRGTWSGSWGGSPLTLVVVEQGEAGGRAGVYVGPVPAGAVLGGWRDPRVSGVITFTVRGEAVSTGVRGRLGHLAGTVALVLEAATPDGALELVLNRVEADRLTGSGESSFAWGPTGPVELTRAPSRGSQLGAGRSLTSLRIRAD